MLRIRLLRVGRKNSRNFRLVVTPQRSGPKTGKFLELLGSCNPPKHEFSFHKERVEYWLAKGAQPSDTVRNLLISHGALLGKKVPVHKRAVEKKAEVLETPKTETPKVLTGN